MKSLPKGSKSFYVICYKGFYEKKYYPTNHPTSVVR